MSVDNQDIWRLQAQYDVSGLKEALQSADAVRRKRAAAALRAIDAREAIPALRAAFEKETDEDARSSIAAALVSLTGEAPQAEAVEETPQPSIQQALVTRLIRQLEADNPEEVIKAAQQLGDLGDRLAVEPLVMLFNDVSRSVELRLAVAEALLKLESAPVEVTLLAALRHNEWQTRRNGAAILGQLRATWAVPPLVNAMRDPHPIVRRTARAALRRIGTPEARRALEAYAASQIQPTLRGSAGLSAPGGGLLRKISIRTGANRANTQPLDPRRVEAATRAAEEASAKATEPTPPAPDTRTQTPESQPTPDAPVAAAQPPAEPAQSPAMPDVAAPPPDAPETEGTPSAPAAPPISRANTQPLDPGRVERIEAGLALPPGQGVLKHITSETLAAQPGAKSLTPEEVERLRKLEEAVEEAIQKGQT